MVIDCTSCVMRMVACGDCMVNVLVGDPPEDGFDEDEQRALVTLVDYGLIPPLRVRHALPVAA